MSLNFIITLISLGFLCLPVNSFAQNEQKYDPLKERIILPLNEIPNYREEMRNIVVTLSDYAKNKNPDFFIVIKGGEYLLYRENWENLYDELDRAQKHNAKTPEEIFIINLFAEQSESQKIGSPSRRFARSIDGFLIFNHYCNNSDLPKEAINTLKDFNIAILGEEICPSEKILAIQKQAASHAVPLYTAPDIKVAFKTIPSEAPFMDNATNVNSLKDARNILVVTDTNEFSDKQNFINLLKQTNYDILILDPIFQNKYPLTKEEVYSLKFKKNGAKRLVLASLNLATIKDTDFLWKKNWKLQNPSWLRKIADNDDEAIVVEYWKPEWQKIIGNYFNGILSLDFDGVVFQDLNRHLEFEELTPIDY